MKKKGLIVATIVMVLVLAVSLSTATYAWFTADSKTTIAPIEFKVSSGSDVSIGLKADNIYADGVGIDAFRTGNTTILESASSIPTKGTDYWGGDIGLGNAIDMQLDLTGMSKAVGTGTIAGESTTGAVDTSFTGTAIRTEATDTAKGMVMASGKQTTVTASTIEKAIAQKNYLDVVIGVQAAQADLETITCNITVNPNSGKSLGMNAAIHVAWAINGMIGAEAFTAGENGTTTGHKDVYGENSYTTTLSTLAKTLCDSNTNTVAYGGTSDQTLNDGAANVAIQIANAGSGNKISTATIYQIHLLIWIDGNDSDCRNEALNVGSDIYINFSATAPSRKAQSQD